MITALVAAALLASASTADTIHTVDGGRVTGTVLEESPTTGVTIQTADGAVRRIERDQISRIEFADGTVSNLQPTAPPTAAAPAPVPASAPRAAAPEGALDSVYFRGSGRARGTVMEESPSGVKIRLLDGSIRAYSADEVTRIEYADGTVSTPKAPAKPEPAAAPLSKPARALIDTAYFVGSGRVRGTVIEESPTTGVRVRLLDSTIQTYSRDELQRIEYSDGSVSRRAAPPPASAPAAAPQPPPTYPQQTVATPPPAPAPPQQKERPQLFPLYVSLGVGATFLSGDAAAGVSMSSVFTTTQPHVSSELGLRLTPSFAFGVYGEVGGGDASQEIRNQCSQQDLDCAAATGRFGFMVRHAWGPLSRRPTWLSLGTGWEIGTILADQRSGNGSGSRSLSYTGRELIRLGAGIDFRSNNVVALGLYGTVSAGEYDTLEDRAGAKTSIDRATHTTAQLGLKLTLFP